jgi:hypothetical protein
MDSFLSSGQAKTCSMNECVILLVVLHFTKYSLLEIDEVMIAEWNRNFQGQA